MSGMSQEMQIGVGVVGGLAALAALFVSLLATGVIQTGPDEFNVVSVTDASGVARNPNFIGHYVRQDMLTTGMTSSFIDRVVTSWTNQDTTTQDDIYSICLLRAQANDPVSRLMMWFIWQTGTDTLQTGPQSIVDSASNLFAAQDPILFDGLWTQQSDVANGTTDYDPTDTSIIDRKVTFART